MHFSNWFIHQIPKSVCKNKKMQNNKTYLEKEFNILNFKECSVGIIATIEFYEKNYQIMGDIIPVRL